MSKNQSAKRQAIHQELLKLAKARGLTETQRFPSYKEFGEPRGWWDLRGAGGLLNDIWAECRQHNLPDVTILLRRKDTRRPSMLNGVHVGKRKLTSAEEQYLHDETQRLIDLYCPRTPNPY